MTARAAAWLSIGTLLLGACSAPRFTPADPADPDRIVCSTGRITRLEVHSDGTFALDLAPDGEGKHLLAPSQSELICEMLDPEHAKNFSLGLRRHHVGMRAKVCGYWIRDAEREGRFMIRPVTALLHLQD